MGRCGAVGGPGRRDAQDALGSATPARPPAAPPPPSPPPLLTTPSAAGSSSWRFDVFGFEAQLNRREAAAASSAAQRPATLLVYYLLDYQGTIDTFGLDRKKLLRWLTKVEEGYSGANAYHNALHAADVTASLYYFLQQPALARHTSPLDMLAALLAAVVHDLGHPGVNNTFLETTRDALSVTYNDSSVLENHHISTAFTLLAQDECNWAEALSEDQYRDLRETMIGMVLGTDMKAHFEHLTKFKSKLAGDGFGEHLERKDVRLLLLMALHAADICNPAKPRELSLQWSARVMEEFFAQGDRERALGLPISPFMDRTKEPVTTTITKCQVGFINVLVRPFFQEWSTFLGEAFSREVLPLLSANAKLWENEGAEICETVPAFSSLVSRPGEGWSKSPGQSRRRSLLDGLKISSKALASSVSPSSVRPPQAPLQPDSAAPTPAGSERKSESRV